MEISVADKLEVLKQEVFMQVKLGLWRPSPDDRAQVIRQTIIQLKRLKAWFHPRDHFAMVMRYWNAPRPPGSIPSLIALAYIIGAIQEGTLRWEHGILSLGTYEEQASEEEPRSEILTEDIRTRGGYVYIFQAVGTLRVKIGRSASLQQRHHTVHTSSPFPIALVRKIETSDALKLETSLHQRYKQYRQHREWFELPPDLLLALLHEEFTQEAQSL